MRLRSELISHVQRTFYTFPDRLADHLADRVADLLTFYEAEAGYEAEESV